MLNVPASVLANFTSGDTGYLIVSPITQTDPSTAAANGDVLLEATGAGSEGAASYQ
jgi:hypothetical protein